jgi:hypothetical protein
MNAVSAVSLREKGLPSGGCAAGTSLILYAEVRNTSAAGCICTLAGHWKIAHKMDAFQYVQLICYMCLPLSWTFSFIRKCAVSLL